MIDPFELPFKEGQTLTFEATLPIATIGRRAMLEDPATAIQALTSVDGAFLLIDKPYARTSFSIVNGIRKKISLHTGIKRVKVGHAGTLDPLATGLLILATRRATKSISDMMGLDKTYLLRLRLGITSPSEDLETRIVITGDPSAVTDEQIREVVSSFEGASEQVPPSFSAVKQQGRPVYHLARAGKAVTLESRSISMHSIEILSIARPYVDIRVRCGKGTYIRSFVRDVGQALGVGALMVELRRECIGEWEVEDALGVDEALDLLRIH